jgi:hypothetical protein
VEINRRKKCNAEEKATRLLEKKARRYLQEVS